jgi:hypothetical protein
LIPSGSSCWWSSDGKERKAMVAWFIGISSALMLGVILWLADRSASRREAEDETLDWPGGHKLSWVALAVTAMGIPLLVREPASVPAAVVILGGAIVLDRRHGTPV